MRVAAQIAGSLCALAIVVILFALFVTSAETTARSRDCFEAGGRAVDEVCMPVEGALKP